LGALLPDKVFPHALWQQAYAEFWEWSVQAASFRYQVEKPPFPNAVTLPEKHFPIQLCRAPIEHFFAEITKLIEISELEKGIDYIIEATYGEGNYPFQEEKKSLFRALRQEETSHENLTRTHGPMKITSMEAVNYYCITESFFDTIIVDKAGRRPLSPFLRLLPAPGSQRPYPGPCRAFRLGFLHASNHGERPRIPASAFGE